MDKANFLKLAVGITILAGSIIYSNRQLAKQSKALDQFGDIIEPEPGLKPDNASKYGL